MTADALARQMVAFDRCVTERDAVLAGSVLDATFALILVQPAPAMVTRGSWLRVLPDYITDEYIVEEQQVDVDGDCAVVLQRIRMKATVLGQDRSGLFVISDIWRRRDGEWRIWRRHSTPLSAGSLPGATRE